MESENYTCVLCGENQVYTSEKRGVLPLIELLDSEADLDGFAAADKIVGSAAAFLYILMGVKEVYAPVMSDKAAELLCENGIKAYSDLKVKSIINRKGTGICPMEQAVENITVPSLALDAVKAKLRRPS